MSGNYYCRASGQAVFKVAKPVSKQVIGYDRLPDYIKYSDVYTANNLGRFANTDSIPDKNMVEQFIEEISNLDIPQLECNEQAFFRYLKQNDFTKMLKSVLSNPVEFAASKKKFLEVTAKCALENGDAAFAWKTAVYAATIS